MSNTFVSERTIPFPREKVFQAWTNPELLATWWGPAGFRTLDSVIRAKEIFSLTGNITIISQPFHIERALFIARAYDIDAVGYGAANVSLSFGALPYIREIGARWLAIYDLIFGTDPVVLGEKVEIMN